MWYTTSRYLHHIVNTPINIGVIYIIPSTTVRNLGVTMNKDFSMKTNPAFIYIKAIRRSLTTEATKILVSNFVCSEMDYCNTVFASLPGSTTDRLNDVLHASAQLITGCHKYYHSDVQTKYTGFKCIRSTTVLSRLWQTRFHSTEHQIW